MIVNAKGAGTSLPTVFDFGANKIEAIIINDEPCFVAADVCDALGLSNPTKMLLSLDDDEKLTSELFRSGQKRKVNLINESGLYNLIFRSYRPEAKAFRKWVTSEVLPAIRQKRLYGQVITTSALRKKCSTINFNGRMLYAYRDVQRALGYCTRSSTSDMQRLYGGQVGVIGGKCYVSEDYVGLMVHRASVREKAKNVQMALPLLPPEFNNDPRLKF